jgi:hypothetical protein
MLMIISRGGQHILYLLLLTMSILCLMSCFSAQQPAELSPTELSQEVSPTPTAVPVTQPTATPVTLSFQISSGQPRGYLTTPQELMLISQKAEQGLKPYHTAMADVLEWADKDWDYGLNAHEGCSDADDPAWIDDQEGVPILYAKALAYHLTGNSQYAEEVRDILEQIMTEVKTISLDEQQCRLNFSWGVPEMVAAADLIEMYWKDQTCTGPTGTRYADPTIDTGNCKILFQNWLVKNPYYVVSYTTTQSQSNWGAAATNTAAYIADYLWDRPDMLLVHRNPPQVNEGKDTTLNPAEAYTLANKLALDRMNGYAVEYASSESCDYLADKQQSKEWAPVKSQITERGIIPEDARREEYCNIPNYNGKYQNYPQVHLGNLIQQCELMLRRGDRSCFDNVDNSDFPDYTFVDPNGKTQETHLYPGRGSLERAINAIIVDSNTEWRHDSALEVAFRYYYNHRSLPGFEFWFQQLDRPGDCSQDVCFGTLTHGFAPGENPELPLTAPPPLAEDLAEDASQ